MSEAVRIIEAAEKTTRPVTNISMQTIALMARPEQGLLENRVDYDPTATGFSIYHLHSPPTALTPYQPRDLAPWTGSDDFTSRRYALSPDGTRRVVRERGKCCSWYVKALHCGVIPEIP